MAGSWPKVIRDPVHELIPFEDTPCDRLLWDLINTKEFQRLRRIKQLGVCELVFPGANHSAVHALNRRDARCAVVSGENSAGLAGPSGRRSRDSCSRRITDSRRRTRTIFTLLRVDHRRSS